jgi:hypothetical protein
VKSKKKTGKPRATVAGLQKEVKDHIRQWDRMNVALDHKIQELAAAIHGRMSRIEREVNSRTCTVDDMIAAFMPVVHKNVRMLQSESDAIKADVDHLTMRLVAAETMIQTLANPPKVARANGVGRSLLRPLLRKLRLVR